MYCSNCGREISNMVESCPNCGAVLRGHSNVARTNANTRARSDYHGRTGESKQGMGVVFGLFLSILGLIIGVCMYSDGTFERSTFMKGWGIGFGISIAIGVISGIIYGAVIGGILATL
ncbi:MAG: zinc ribbon domain-containing protein [Clostridia bacterium]|nr:zinc ribbon domain-containing protein [Clostridia bacterium]